MMTVAKAWEPEDPRKIYAALIERCKQAKEWCIPCFVNESWVPPDNFPFDMFITDGVYFFRVICSTQREAMLKVMEFVPVIKFLDELRDE
jgi:hypothetical protein